MGSFILDFGGSKEHHICPCVKPAHPESDERIPVFYSELHAYEKGGWRKTSHPRYCPPDEPFVWVCPGHWNRTIKEQSDAD